MNASPVSRGPSSEVSIVMPHDIPKMEAAGWKSFDFTLMRGAGGLPLLVSDEIIRDYLAYVSTCRQAKSRTMSFSDWITTSGREGAAVQGLPVR